MAGVDPCSLISAEQIAALAPDMRKSPQTNAISKAPVCLLTSNTTQPTYSITPSTVDSITKFEGTNQSRISAPTAVLGFPAVNVYRPTDLEGCFTVVDVADGQSLMTQLDDSTGTSIDQICAASEKLANTAMTSLLAQG